MDEQIVLITGGSGGIGSEVARRVAARGGRLSKNLWQSETTAAADIAPAVRYFLSNESAWTTGQILGVDGGLSAGMPPARATLGEC